MARPRSPRAARRARQLELVLEQLRRDPHTPVPELVQLLQRQHLGAHVRTVYLFRDEARARLPPPPAKPPTGWPVTVAAARLSIRRKRLRQMMATVGMPAPQVDRATGTPRWPEADWRALETRFEAAVLRRAAVIEALSPGHPHASGLQLPPPAGHDGHGHWWLPADIEAWVRAGRGRRRAGTWWTHEELAHQLALHPAAVPRLCSLPGFPGPERQGRWDATQVRAWLRNHRDWKDRVASDATLDMRAAAAYVGLSYDTVRTYRARGTWPAPDGWHGRTPRWSNTTLQCWRDRTHARAHS